MFVKAVIVFIATNFSINGPHFFQSHLKQIHKEQCSILSIIQEGVQNASHAPSCAIRAEAAMLQNGHQHNSCYL